ncbi:MAG TPA: tyrosine--tRNA ligase [Clostridia bacterium]|jgi:tyrosyl-tRNA synthetase|nr:tyrosine--tRNA ligase [Clostridiaceae bacterium]HOF26927.1 tyrosine--tRNA ligase [Clostridia bacterium]HOM34581.1 tyrosine--tRNA ligase [Clostridia bacterium]HOR89931.1 tyrosine--tRNA ligase [Clostridia bacterium]HPL08281.1 tyrosine--tRNA ligase [Clostridia bacterium]
MKAYDILKERGFIAQATDEEAIKNLLNNEKIVFYIGFDPTADSLHIGHFLQLIVMSHLQKAGHKPIALLGGGTAMIGDPTGKTDMRRIMTREEIDYNASCFKKQMSRFVDFTDDRAIMVDNYEWLSKLEYIPFLREIGMHFSVNRMLTAECFKSRLEKGLSFIEFNYMLMQSYDFLLLRRKYGCILQLGGDDQWSNIISGVDLIRRKELGEAYGMTFNLLTTNEGKKMGKTEKGAIWLDENKTSPFDFYQYWRNIDDAEVIKCLKLLTFLPMEEIKKLSKLKDAEINHAKEVLAYEVTKIVHGEKKADDAKIASRALFSNVGEIGNMPSKELTKNNLEEGYTILDALTDAGFIKSNSEGRRLIQEKCVSVNDIVVEDFKLCINSDMFTDGEMLLRRGKKKYFRFILK